MSRESRATGATLDGHDPLHGLKELDQWVCWEYGSAKGEQKQKKIPVDPHTGKWLSWKNPSTWLFYEQARRHPKIGDTNGYGLVTIAEDGYYFIDIDHCLDPATREITKEWVERLVKHLNSYTEVSPSGRGLRIILRGSLDRFKTRTKDHYYLWEGHRIEVFDRDHFVTITEDEFLREPIREAQPFIDTLTPADSNVNRTMNLADLPKHHLDGDFYEDRRYVRNVLIVHDLDPSPIPEHFRKTTLLSYGGVLLMGGMTEGDLWVILNKINKVLLCNGDGELEGLPPEELREVYRTIIKLEPKVAPKEVQDILDATDSFLLTIRPLMKGSKNTDLDLVRALIRHGRKYGSMEGDEVRVDVSQRTLMGLARIKSKETYNNSRKRLKTRCGIHAWWDRGDRSGHFVFDPTRLTNPRSWGLPADYAKPYQSKGDTPTDSSKTNSGSTHPHYLGTVNHTFWYRGFGKSKMKYISTLVHLGGGARNKDIAVAVGSKPGSISGALRELVEMEVLTRPSRGYYELAPDWEEKVYLARINKGEFDRDDAFREKIKDERKEYRRKQRAEAERSERLRATPKTGCWLTLDEAIASGQPANEAL